LKFKFRGGFFSGNKWFGNRVRLLERGLWIATGLCIVLFLSLLGVIVCSSTSRVEAAEEAKVLRLRGLIIEDSEGRARIMLGSPMPEVPERLRKDCGTDLVFLDEQGHDRFRVGEMLPAVPGFHRIGSSYGATILDTQGGERGGIGFLSNDKNVNRAVIALDRPYNPSVSADAWGAIVDDATGFASTGYMYSPGKDHDQEAIRIGTIGERAVITFKDRNDKVRASFALADGSPSFELFDKTGKPERDLLKASQRSSEKR
jgi:hypothetical protein